MGITLDEARIIAERKGEEVVPTFCGMCGPGPFGCGIYAFVKNGRFVRVAGMRESPVNHGALCSKGNAAPQWVYSPDRLRYPLKRTGAKGEGRFERISWDDAINIVADTLKKQKEAYGPESLASCRLLEGPTRRCYSVFSRHTAAPISDTAAYAPCRGPFPSCIPLETGLAPILKRPTL